MLALVHTARAASEGSNSALLSVINGRQLSCARERDVRTVHALQNASLWISGVRTRNEVRRNLGFEKLADCENIYLL